jgi:hypothetical protein
MRVCAILLVLPFLAACSGVNWDSLTSFGTSERPQAAAPAPVSVARAAAAQPAPNAFCMAVARQDATGNGFDTATQQRVAISSYQQCVGVFGNVAE